MQYIEPQTGQTQQEGIVSDYGNVFDLTLKDSEIIALTNKMIADSESFWNGLGLKEAREKNLRYWKGDQLKGLQFYNHNVRYVDNRIFPSTETIVATVCARMPYPEVFPDQNTQTSTIIAKDVSKALVAYTENNEVADTFQFALRHLLTDRIGWIKLRFDDSLGKNGEIVTEYVLPEDIVVDKEAKPGTNPRFLSQVLRGTVEDLIKKFPEKEQEILKKFGIIRGTKGQLGKFVAYKEVWFTYYDGDKKQEAVCWRYDDLIMGKMKNPNWNEGGNNEITKNFLNHPLKPFIPLNYLNSGRYFIDDTSIIEQAIPLQDVLNKRGRQIIENADSANGGWVLSSKAITAENASELIGDPNEKVLVNADDVRTAVARTGAPSLPSYVLEDKIDARNEIDNMFATNKVARGETSGNRTLGQDQIQLAQDTGRQNQLMRAVEKAANRYYKFLLQMMKVYYTEDHWFMITGRNGLFDSVVLRADIIKDGMDVRVKAGSSLPLDKVSEKQMYADLAAQKMIDPLTLMEELGVPEPKDKLERLVQWTLDPMSMLQMIDKEKWDREAFMDIQILNRGVIAPPTEEVTEEHLAYHNEYLKSGEYRKQKDNIKQNHVNHVALEAEELRRTLLLEETQMPTAEEVQAGNQQMDQASMQDQAMGGMPPQEKQPLQPPQPMV